MCPESRGKGKRVNRWLVSAVQANSQAGVWLTVCREMSFNKLRIFSRVQHTNYMLLNKADEVAITVGSLDSWAAAGATLNRQPGHPCHLVTSPTSVILVNYAQQRHHLPYLPQHI